MQPSPPLTGHNQPTFVRHLLQKKHGVDYNVMHVLYFFVTIPTFLWWELELLLQQKSIQNDGQKLWCLLTLYRTGGIYQKQQQQLLLRSHENRCASSLPYGNPSTRHFACRPHCSMQNIQSLANWYLGSLIYCFLVSMCTTIMCAYYHNNNNKGMSYIMANVDPCVLMTTLSVKAQVSHCSLMAGTEAPNER